MKVLVIDNKTKYLKELLQYLPGEKIVIYSKELEKVRDNFDLLVLTGGRGIPTVLHHPDVYKSEIDFIKKTTKPILGICLGSEILTVAFGGTLKDLGRKEQGECQIFLGGIMLDLKEAHSIGVNTLPSDFEVLGYSSHGPEIIKYKQRPIIGLQFHPEISQNKIFDRWLFKELRIDL